MPNFGTRISSTTRNNHPAGGHPSTELRADLGLLSESIPAALSFVQPASLVGVTGDFTAHFTVGQLITIRGTNMNDGDRTVLSIAASGGIETMNVDPGVKTEGPLSTVTIRSP